MKSVFSESKQFVFHLIFSALFVLAIVKPSIGDSSLNVREAGVGIGTDSPDALLHVKTTSGVTQAKLEFDDNNATFILDPGPTFNGALMFREAGTNRWSIKNQGPNNTFQIEAGGSLPKFAITQAGYVGIGTTSPAATLDVYAGNVTIARLNAEMDTELHFDAKGNPKWRIQNHNGENLAFVRNGSTVAEGSVLYLIKDTGNVGIGTTAPQQKLHVAGKVLATQYLTTSSQRFKTNIKPIEGAMDKVLRLRGVSYDWKADGKHDIGLVAEEVGAVIPEVVAYEENGKDVQSVDYARLVSLLIEAVKEQHQTIRALETRVAALEAAAKN